MCFVDSLFCFLFFFFFKQKTAYEMRISDWSSDVCSSDLERLASALGPTTIPELKSGPNDGDADAIAAMLHRREDSVHTVLSRSEEHTSELQSLMRISYAVFCLKKKKRKEHKERYRQR